MRKQIDYTIIFFITGLIVIIYSFVVKLFFENKEVGITHDSSISEFMIYVTLGITWILFSIIYFLFDKKTNIKLSIKQKTYHYFSTLVFLLILLSVPILNKYHPTDQNRESIIWDIFAYVGAISFFAFLTGLGIFLFNLISSTIKYLTQKK